MAMIEETWAERGVGRGEVIEKIGADEERAQWIAYQLGGGIEDVVEPGSAACRHHNDAMAVIALILVRVVQSDFTMPGLLFVLGGVDRLGAVVEFDEIAEALPLGIDQIEPMIGYEQLARNVGDKSIFGMHVDHAKAFGMRGDSRVNEKLGEGVHVVMAGDRDFGEELLRRWSRLVAVEQS